MMEIVTALAGVIGGFLIGWFIKSGRAKADAAVASERMTTLDQQLGVHRQEIIALKDTRSREAAQYLEAFQALAGARAIADRVPVLEEKLQERQQLLSQRDVELATACAQLVEERKALAEQRKLLDDAQVALSNSFKALSADALKSNNQAFIDLAKATLEKFQEGARGDLEARHKAVNELVAPLRESLQKVDGKLGEIEKSRISAYSALSDQLKSLVETHIPMLRGETANLVKALRQPTVRGRWGEMQLHRVVEMAGMVDHCDFLEQESRSTEDGSLRPDMIVKLPGGKQIVVDAKAPVAAYLDAAEAPDDDIRQLRLNDHARQVRDHMIALGRKAYWEQFTPSPEFVVMFLPGEMFFSAALQQDPGLIEFGVNEKVIPATPTTLIALLRAVSYGWRQEALAANAQEVAQLGKQIFERISTLAEHWTDVGQRLGKAVDSYNKSVVTLESRVLVSARRFRDLKAAPEGTEIEAIEPVEIVPRALQAPEFVVERLSDGSAVLDQP